MDIIKADGTTEVFHPEKLRESLLSAGASLQVAGKIVAHIEEELTGQISSSDLYRHAFDLLRSSERRVAARYSLKRAIAALGPSGFPFEKYIAELFKVKGYTVLTDQFLNGKCAEHEVDVVAWKQESLVAVEAKFHNELGVKSDLKVALYIKARFDDLRNEKFTFGGRERGISDFLLITNTKFTEKAIQYSECAGVALVGWNYPERGNLHDMIEETNLHPITCLSVFSQADFRMLFDRGIVLCRSVREEAEKVREIGINEQTISRAIEESNAFCPIV